MFTRATLLSVAAVLVTALAVQVPLGFGHNWQTEHHQAILGSHDIAEWSLDKLPNSSATDHLVFETVYSLLQHWPNTRMRNGKQSPCACLVPLERIFTSRS